MEKVKKVCVDPRYKTKEYVSTSGFKFEIKESFDIPENTACYLDGLSIPHTWYTIETHNNQMYAETTSSISITCFYLNNPIRQLHSTNHSNYINLIIAKKTF